jgi:hypothetical protein
MLGNNTPVENIKLRFARQLYETTLERHGADHEQTHLLREYVSELERHHRPNRQKAPVFPRYSSGTACHP